MTFNLSVPATDSGRAGGSDLYVGLFPENEDGLARFDAAYEAFEPNATLLAGTPARSLAEALENLVIALKRVDIDRVMKRQGWWDRFTGADLEARIELEVAARRLGEDMRRTAEAAAEARHAVAAMNADLPRLDAAQGDHRGLADATALFLRTGDSTHPVVARLQRRLGNLEALYASNRLARAQMELAVGHLVGLLDRFTDIEQLLFPVWQRHALAIAQSAAPAEAGVIQQLRSIHARFENALHAPRNMP